MPLSATAALISASVGSCRFALGVDQATAAIANKARRNFIFSREKDNGPKWR